MNKKLKSNFYDLNKQCIHPVIKSHPSTKPLWRKLYWSTAKNSCEYKCGCVDILQSNFPYLFNELIKIFEKEISQK